MQNELYEDIGQIYTAVTGLVLTTGLAQHPIEAAVSSIKTALSKLRPGIEETVPESVAESARARSEYFRSAGVPVPLADVLTTLSVMTIVPEIMQIAAESRTTLAKTAEGYFGTTQNLKIARLLMAAQRIVTTDQYEAMALARSVGDITSARRSITLASLTQRKSEKAAVETRGADKSARVVEQLAQLTESGEITLAKISVAAGFLGDLARSAGR